MAHCYRCGRLIDDTKLRVRRKVRTGGYERRRYGRGRADLVQSHYGMRVVCGRCARSIDFSEHRLRIEGDLKVLAALAAMVAVVLLMQD